MAEQLTLCEVLKQIDEESEQSSAVSIDDLVAHFQSRGFGPLIMFPALIAGLPTGAFPGVPSLCGLSVALISMQLIWGKTHPWLPRKIADMELDSQRIQKIVPKALPWAKRVDYLIKPRLKVLTTDKAQRIIAVITTLLGLSMVPLELVPLGAGIPAWVLVIMALGFTGRDGLLILLSLLVALVGFIWVIF
ncbi:exopolysaccharide biosynthesis protein [Marinicella gelatinilytica]|uniref:exopolysaccharide biosynthesis protein n=1 Tax=Marinicella gelatinilytica TaxID=2996017 RepID=UPI00226101CE|nr:exopolysaccharide biosynthesis protein [Marinicella gelatinilytica]MCX7546010.1 exopolysaccharide biosynthesis protein [Marinicella gelatinilytica]